MTKIQWTHMPGFKGETWNPIVGCSIVSKGCTNCYAMKMADRILRMTAGDSHYAGTVTTSKGGPVWTGLVTRASEKAIRAPLRAKAPRCYFVNSMGDLFAERAPEPWVVEVFAIMALRPQHRFLILTKRPDRMRAFIEGPGVAAGIWRFARRMQLGDSTAAMRGHHAAGAPDDRLPWPLSNVWLGTSVEDQASADERIPILLQTPAVKRFISAEPLLGPVTLNYVVTDAGKVLWDFLRGSRGVMSPEDGPDFDEVDGLDWVICGGESGPGARRMDAIWAAHLLSQCARADVPFFMKQMARRMPIPGPLQVRQFPDTGPSQQEDTGQ